MQSTYDAARFLSLSQKTIRRYIHEGLLKATRLGKSGPYRIADDDLRRFANSNKVTTRRGK